MEKESLHIVVIGEKDHGKSTLIGRLLFETGALTKDRIKELKIVSQRLGQNMEFAFLVDQLKEERDGRLTIDVAQSFFETKKHYCTIIDVPGHVEFLKQMMSGASQADLAVLLIDATEGLREQTYRHLNLLSLLGIKDLIAAVNKMDLADYAEKRFTEIKKKILDFSRSANLNAFKIIPISAKKGDNILRVSGRMAWYKDFPLLEALDAIRLNLGKIKKPLRFYIQDAYTGERKKIFVGKVALGKMNKGQKVISLPSFQKAEIGSILVFGKRKKKAGEGESIGITLKENILLKRGDIICSGEKLPEPVKKFKAKIFWISDILAYPGQKMSVRCVTQKSRCSLAKILRRIDPVTLETIENNPGIIKKNEIGIVTFDTQAPLVLEDFNFIPQFGRIVLENKNEICAVGIVSAVHPLI